MQIKTGVDIIEVDRVQEAIENQEEKFLEKVYTKNEIEYCSNSGKMTYQHYAARFAAKEAIFKAISEFIPKNEDDILNKIEITNEQDGKPYANIDRLNIDNIESMDLSLSHIKNYAIASFVILFK
jgi:holo-[acyl-carrier protein] synthase